ncbi:hypothetical protein ABRP63_11250 [Corynebacterium sp. KPL2623]|uniref:hypothetical protein n=1 Tax=unclassified Corynebacterium TaxID=2624378 RepID=UPI00254AE693|nr:hypothetical protein [Corynebacterium kefirresidentii]MDK8838151.1 hypothetical protein [Corynebacterium kefirresidentii]
MSKQDRAAKAIDFAAKRGYGPEQIATLLNELELLAPDLPEPNDPSTFVPDGKGWLPGGPYDPVVWTAPDSRIIVQRIEPGDLTPDEARGVAYALLAAAQYAEEEA